MPALKEGLPKKRLVSARVQAYRVMEGASLDLQHPELTAAIERFKQHPDPVFLLGLAREIAQTRRSELTLAYRNLLTVAAGWRLKRAAGEQAPLLSPEPCVVLVVRKKWRSGTLPADMRQHLPAHFLIGAEHEGARRLYAVPTDVQAAEPFVGGQAFGATAVVTKDPARPAFGTVTCAVHLRPLGGAAPRLCMLSAMHVFTPFAEVRTGLGEAEAGVFQEPHPEPPTQPMKPQVGHTTAWRGRLLRSGFSFDAQLAEVDLDWLRRQLVDMPLSAQQPFVASPEALDQLNVSQAEFTLHAADNHRNHGQVLIKLGGLKTELSSVSLDYKMRDSGGGMPTSPTAPLVTVAVRHWELLQFSVRSKTAPQPGDSGAAVLARRSDNSLTLVGMFIGANLEKRVVYVLPAWQLFDPANWNRDSPLLTHIEPVNL